MIYWKYGAGRRGSEELRRPCFLRRESGNDLSQSKTQALLRMRNSRLYNPLALLRSAPSRAVETALRSGNGAHYAPFPSSQVAKSPPGSLQESTCSPLTQGGLRRGRKSGKYSLSLISGVRVEWHDTVSRGRDRAAPLPTHLLRICAGALKRRALCAVSKFASGKEPTGLFARKHLLPPQEGANNKEKRPVGTRVFCSDRAFGLPRTQTSSMTAFSEASPRRWPRR